MKSNNLLHSHSEIEGKLLMPKNRVLVDERFRDMFGEFCNPKTLVVYQRERFYSVPTILFVRKGGIFQR